MEGKKFYDRAISLHSMYIKIFLTVITQRE